MGLETIAWRCCFPRGHIHKCRRWVCQQRSMAGSSYASDGGWCDGLEKKQSTLHGRHAPLAAGEESRGVGIDMIDGRLMEEFLPEGSNVTGIPRFCYVIFLIFLELNLLQCRRRRAKRRAFAIGKVDVIICSTYTNVFFFSLLLASLPTQPLTTSRCRRQHAGFSSMTDLFVRTQKIRSQLQLVTTTWELTSRTFTCPCKKDKLAGASCIS